MYSVTFSGRSVLYEGARDKITLHLHHNGRQVSPFAFAVTFVFFFSCVCVIPLSIGDRVPVAVLLWRGLWPHQRPGLQDSGERETWKVLTTSSLVDPPGCGGLGLHHHHHHHHLLPPVDPPGCGGHHQPGGGRAWIQSPVPTLLHPPGSCSVLGTCKDTKTGVDW